MRAVLILLISLWALSAIVSQMGKTATQRGRQTIGTDTLQGLLILHLRHLLGRLDAEWPGELDRLLPFELVLALHVALRLACYHWSNEGFICNGRLGVKCTKRC